MIEDDATETPHVEPPALPAEPEHKNHVRDPSRGFEAPPAIATRKRGASIAAAVVCIVLALALLWGAWSLWPRESE